MYNLFSKSGLLDDSEFIIDSLVLFILADKTELRKTYKNILSTFLSEANADIKRITGISIINEYIDSGYQISEFQNAIAYLGIMGLSEQMNTQKSFSYINTKDITKKT